MLIVSQAVSEACGLLLLSGFGLVYLHSWSYLLSYTSVLDKGLQAEA